MTFTADQTLDLDGIRAAQYTYRFDVLDATNTVIGTLAIDEDSAPEITNEPARNIPRTMSGLVIPPSVPLNAPANQYAQDTLDPIIHRVRPVFVLADGTEYNRGVFLFADDQEKPHTYGTVAEANMVDQCLIVDQPLDGSLGYGVGTLVHSIVTDRLTALGFATTGVTVAAQVLAAPLVWAVGRDTSLKVINDCCALLGYFPLYMDNDGLPTARPSYGLSASAPDFTYGTGTTVIMDSVVQSNDLLDAPNRYVVYESSGTQTTIVGVYDIPVDAPHSLAHRGFAVTKAESLQGLVDATAAADAAEALYFNDDKTYAHLSFASTPNPRHDTYDLLDWEGVLYREASWHERCQVGAPMGHTARSLYVTV